jgi:integrase/recombinase XerC
MKLVRVATASSALTRQAGPADLVEVFFRNLSPRTVEAYRADFVAFARFLGLANATDPVAASLDALCVLPAGEAHAVALSYRGAMLDAGLSPATVNRRIAALRSVVRLAARLGRVPWLLDIPSVRAEAYRDTRGPGLAGYRQLLSALEARGDLKAKRDRAILRLLFDCGLRRAEAVGLDVADVLPGEVRILGKGRRQTETRPLPAPTAAALADYLAEAGHTDGALFRSLDRRDGGRRITLPSVSRLVRDLGEGVGVRVTPHGLRHSAITELLEATNGNVDRVRDFSRHADVKTLMLYNDRRTSAAPALSDHLAALA